MKPLCTSVHTHLWRWRIIWGFPIFYSWVTILIGCSMAQGLSSMIGFMLFDIRWCVEILALTIVLTQCVYDFHVQSLLLVFLTRKWERKQSWWIALSWHEFNYKSLVCRAVLLWPHLRNENVYPIKIRYSNSLMQETLQYALFVTVVLTIQKNQVYKMH